MTGIAILGRVFPSPYRAIARLRITSRSWIVASRAGPTYQAELSDIVRGRAGRGLESPGRDCKGNRRTLPEIASELPGFPGLFRMFRRWRGGPPGSSASRPRRWSSVLTTNPCGHSLALSDRRKVIAGNAVLSRTASAQSHRPSSSDCFEQPASVAVTEARIRQSPRSPQAGCRHPRSLGYDWGDTRRAPNDQNTAVPPFSRLFPSDCRGTAARR